MVPEPNMDFLFIVKKREPDVYSYGTYGLINSARFVSERLNREGLYTKVVEVIDNNCIEKTVVKHKPERVILEALWVVPEKVELLAKKYPYIDWYIRVHSKAPFLANEGIALEWLTAYCDLNLDNVFVATNNAEFNDDLLALDIYSVYLPNIYISELPCSLGHLNYQEPDCGPQINISNFGAIRPLKNNLIQAMAAITYGNMHDLRVNFHINGTRTEQKGDNVLKNIRALFKGTGHKLIQHKWYSHNHFLNVVSNMDVGLQVSFSESFNIVAADHVLCGVPVVVSKEISWLPWYTKADCNSMMDIVQKIHRNLNNPLLIKTSLNQYYLDKYNDKSTQVWLRLLHE